MREMCFAPFSDPTKARRYRAVARALGGGLADGTLAPGDARVQAAYDQLIKLPEHTYGSNGGKCSNLPWSNAYMDAHMNDTAFQQTTAGYLDQRAYVDRAVAALADLPLRAQLEKEILASEPGPVSTAGMDAWGLSPTTGAPEGTVQCGDVELGFDSTGAISTLRTGGNRRDWAGTNRTLARFRYISHSEGEFDAYGLRCSKSLAT